MACREPLPPLDPDDGVDVTLIRWMLSLDLEERLAVLQGFADSVADLTHVAKLEGSKARGITC